MAAPYPSPLTFPNFILSTLSCVLIKYMNKMMLTYFRYPANLTIDVACHKIKGTVEILCHSESGKEAGAWLE